MSFDEGQLPSLGPGEPCSTASKSHRSPKRFGRARPGSLGVIAAALFVLVLGLGTGTDTTGPLITPILSDAPGNNGWYRADVTVGWDVRDPESGVAETQGCDIRTVRTEPGETIACYATNNVGITGGYSITIRLDKTAPTVTGATPERPSDANGWYNHAVAFSFTAEDGANGSGIAACPGVTYSGPDSGTASVSGSCTDRAGNLGGRNFSLQYDSTAPRVRAVPGRAPDRYGWYSHAVRISFAGTDALSGVDSCTPPRIYSHPNSDRASVSGQCSDVAGNTRLRTFTFKYSQPLLTPGWGTRVTAPPLLRWVPVRRALYYNVQLWHDGKVLSRWPTRNRLQLRESWAYNGRRHELVPGRYAWYVWPRFSGRYGRAIGKSVFYVSS